ncbi:MAG: bifunctional methylenetetrahydrofolate dehydrogenase/methenyltetrahydrofolate cyclohydrolase [Betaproteobacteria bacterium RIFCSPLOWO2_02_FULL_65_24]|nr:MAG: bifunctional methylenetetrahydrofolate dehydrogenase/methenyltetrahydrofolate cyclohydrolase [Betaproteobacteria bacterium RIFCSPLOWO2_02_FULL_65_24]
METRIIDGAALARELRAALAVRVRDLAARNVHPGLAVVLVGEDPASQIYVRNKTKACDEAGIASIQHQLPASISERDLLGLIAELNRDRKVHGILVQLPLPKHVSAEAVIHSIAPGKDVDGFHPENVGRLVVGNARFVPCTPAGVMRLLDHAGVALVGKHAVVVGRSNIVGKPVALLLLERHATVTICHSRTPDLAAVIRQADVLIAAVGKARLITGEMARPGVAVIDVGINRLPDGKLCGDVDFPSMLGKAGCITPVPGGVGPMTIAMLLENTVRAAELSAAQ